VNLSHVAATVLLVAGTVLAVFSALGMAVMRNVYDRLHYVSLAGYGALLIAVAILVRESFSLIADKALATAALVLIVGPVLVHTTARSLRTRERGDWRSGLDEESEP
jgi:monovalent cation/proton antiporter MnhG/PhaG subunit